MFQNVHPTGGGRGPIKSKSVRYGRNAENTPLRDDGYVHCRQCGWVCHLDRDMHAPIYSASGDGITIIGGQNWGSSWGEGWGDEEWSGRLPEPTVESGCPFCGTYLYE